MWKNVVSLALYITISNLISCPPIFFPCFLTMKVGVFTDFIQFNVIKIFHTSQFLKGKDNCGLHIQKFLSLLRLLSLKINDWCWFEGEGCINTTIQGVLQTFSWTLTIPSFFSFSFSFFSFLQSCKFNSYPILTPKTMLFHLYKCLNFI